MEHELQRSQRLTSPSGSRAGQQHVTVHVGGALTVSEAGMNGSAGAAEICSAARLACLDVEPGHGDDFSSRLTLVRVRW